MVLDTVEMGLDSDGERLETDYEGDAFEGSLYEAADEALGAPHIMIEIGLDQELLVSLCRHRRRRLRDIQASCQVVTRLDRLRGVLRVRGPESNVAEVKKQLACCGGRRKAVPAAVWAELMRTRRLEGDNPQALVAQMQEESGVRVHIERYRQEVRLFGQPEGLPLAEKMLEDLAENCAEAAVVTPATVDTKILQSLAHSCSVTLRVEDSKIVVLGLKTAVAEAVRELKTYMADPQSSLPQHAQDRVKPRAHKQTSDSDSEGNLQAVTEALTKNSVSTNSNPGTGTPESDDLPAMPWYTQDKLAVNGGRRQHPAQAQAAFGGSMQHQTQENHQENLAANGGRCQHPAAAQTTYAGGMQHQAQESHQAMVQQPCRHTCPCCGAGRFCTSCGHPTWTMLQPFDMRQMPQVQMVMSPTSAQMQMSPVGGYFNVPIQYVQGIGQRDVGHLSQEQLNVQGVHLHHLVG